jgi:peptidoglycan hydrolase CwlO-like protein
VHHLNLNIRPRNSLAGGAIAGITLAVILLILAVVIALCVRRSRRRQRDSDLQPESYFIVQSALQPSAPASMPTGAPSKSAQLTLTVAQNRQEYLTAQLRAVQKELETFQGNVGNSGNHLEQAMKQNDALRARIRMLEAEMQSQWGLGLTDSPPAYLAID